jgi:phosphoserine phosphatase RsbU/P
MLKNELTLDQFFEITSKINSSEDLPSLLDYIIHITKQVLDVRGCSLLLFSKEENALIFHTTSGEKSDLLTSLKIPKGMGIAGIVLDTLEPIIVNDAESDPRVYKNIDTEIGFTTKNLICVPMITRGEVQGVLEAVNSNSEEGFTSADLKILLSMSEIAAIAIKNRILIDDIKLKYDQINCLLKISNALRNITNLENFLEIAFKYVLDLVPIERYSFIYKSRSTNEWRLLKSYGFDLGENEKIDVTKGILKEVISEGKPVLVENVDNEKMKNMFPRRYKSKSFVSIPLYVGGEILGVFNVSDKKDLSPFTKSDMNLFVLIANNIVEAYKSLLVKEHEEKLDILQRDLQIASKIQMYSLPVIPKKVGEIEFETHYQSSKEVGGDFYDLIYHSENELSVLIADVSGKGIPAALFMEFSKTILSAEIARNKSIAESLLNADLIIKDRFNYMMLVEIMLLKINLTERKIVFASAGHNRQFYLNAKTKKIELMSGKGIPLGTSMKNFTITEHTIHYSKGDKIILYTDGITETMNKKREMFSEEALIKLIEENEELSVSDLKNKILEVVDGFRESREILDDDCTLLLIQL